MGTPMVHKILFFKNSTSQLSNDVSTAPAAFLDPNLHSPENTQYFTRIWCILENVSFPLKITKKSQTLQHCTETPRSRIKTCDTAFESSDIILFNPKNFGYHWGTHSTSKSSQFNFKIGTKILKQTYK